MKGFAVVVLALFAATLQVANAQPTTSDDLAIVDASGDEAYRLANGPEAGKGNFPHADIVRAWIAGETVSTFHVGMQLGAWRNLIGSDPNSEARLLSMQFTFKDKPFRVIQAYDCDSGNGFALQAAESSKAAWTFGVCLPSVVDPDAATFDAEVNKSLLIDLAGSAIREGDALVDVFAQVLDRSSFDIASQVTSVPTVQDRAPDVGVFSFPFKLGLMGEGHLELFSANPLRSTNGEVGTFVYPVVVRNLADEPATILLESKDVRAGWEVRHLPSVKLPAQGALTMPVFLTVSGFHQHGTTATWTLTASGADGSQARLPLGLAYPDIPQPAGHHPRLFIHSSDGSALSQPAPWMNTYEVDDSAVDSPYPGHGQIDPTTGRTVAEWLSVLRPGLAVGLDFEPDRESLFHASFASEGVVRDATIEVILLRCPPPTTGSVSCTQPLLQGNSSLPDFGPGEIVVDLPLAIVDGIDVVPYEENANLRVGDSHGRNPAPTVDVYLTVAGTQLRLPLRDYQDSVEDVFGVDGDLAMAVTSPQERQANPGDTIVFNLRVTNQGNEPRSTTMHAEGNWAAWGMWARPQGRLGAGQTKDFQFVVNVPEDAALGTLAIFFFVAESVDGPTQILVERGTVEVVEADVPGDAPQDVRGNNVPSLPLGLLLSALGLAARRRN